MRRGAGFEALDGVSQSVCGGSGGPLGGQGRQDSGVAGVLADRVEAGARVGGGALGQEVGGGFDFFDGLRPDTGYLLEPVVGGAADQGDGAESGLLQLPQAHAFRDLLEVAGGHLREALGDLLAGEDGVLVADGGAQLRRGGGEPVVLKQDVAGVG
ncbi:hypothetical protein AB0K52_20050 [Glycomyces sp. NPDC049804]|uniref:hypothetical protein n=1 Tax=Glycomyces sp. NPDC049804 TaxID=3154363 RepID=UPI0034342E3D